MSYITRFPSPVAQTRGDMATLWKSANDRAAMGDGTYGTVQEMDFHVLPTTGVVAVTALNSATSEGFAKIAGKNGIASLVATTAADHRGAQVYIPTLGSFDVDTSSTIVFQADVNLFKCSTFFLGLFETGGTILDASSDLPTDIDFIGFYRKNGGAVTFVSNLDAGTDVANSVSVLASDYYQALTAGASTPTRMGFAISKGRLTRIVVDDVAYKTAVDAFNNGGLPAIDMAVAFAAARGATADETAVRLDVDRIKIFQG